MDQRQLDGRNSKVVQLRPDCRTRLSSERAEKDPVIAKFFEMVDAVASACDSNAQSNVHNEFTADEELLISNEVVFRRRYKVCFGSRHREAALRLKKEMDLSEEDFRTMLQSGAFVRSRAGVRVFANWIFEVVGWMQIFFLGLFGIGLLSALGRVASLSDLVVVALMFISTILLVACLYYYYVAPSVILRRSRLHTNAGMSDDQ